MAVKKLTCIQCPQGCQLIAEFENGYLIKLSGNKCPRGEKYARQEIENPQRTLTTTVQVKNLKLKCLPVKTSQPIPKSKLFEALTEISKVKISQPVKAGEIIARNLLNLGTDLIAGRDAD